MASPYTEQSHPQTFEMDTLRSTVFVKLLLDAYSEMFHGWETSGGLLRKDIMDSMTAVSDIIAQVLKSNKSSKIVMSGCGTSGRLAFLTARHFNNTLPSTAQPSVYTYTISGGDTSLFLSQEAIEDNPHAGKEDLIQASGEAERVVYIGITCGMSAPYVAGQLDYCMNNLHKYVPVLIGFNPVSMARNIQIDGWHHTFKSVAERMEKLSAEKKAYIINPVIGPEPLSGSTRMKGGSATKLVLETILSRAHQLAYEETHSDVGALLSCYEKCHHLLIAHSDKVVAIIDTAGESLRSGGHIYYIGANLPGVVGLIDASECVPTFGADLSDVVGFYKDGFAALENKGGDLSSKIHITFDDFKLLNLTSKDLVLFLNAKDELASLRQQLKDAKYALLDIDFASQTEALPLTTQDGCLHLTVTLPDTVIGSDASNDDTQPSGSQLHSVRRHLAPLLPVFLLKTCCNVITTGAFVKKGKVYHNYMVDVKLSNIKLYHRAIGIVSNFVGTDKQKSEELLLRSIYETDDISDINSNTHTISQHIEVATQATMVVPKALVMGFAECSVQQAKVLLDETPIVRQAIDDTIERHRGH